MPIFKKKKDSQIVVLNLKHQLREAFGNVNYDINHIKQWVNHLAERSQLLEDTHHSHRSTIQRDLENINKWIHYLYRHNHELQKYIKEVTSNLLELHRKDSEILEKLKKLEIDWEKRKISPKMPEKEVRSRTKSGLRSGTGPAKTTKFEQKAMFQLKSKRKEYIIQQILNLVNAQKFSTKELEEKIVKEMSLCGRTTFYDYLKELRNRKIIGYKDTGARKILVELGPVPD